MAGARDRALDEAMSSKGASPKATAQRRANPGALVWLAVLAVASALWSMFLWAQLLVHRAGGTRFCPLEVRGGCAAAWDSALADSVHRLTGLPVAAWGAVWGLAAFFLPLLVLARRAEGRPSGAHLSSVRLVSGAGAAVVALLIAASVAGRTFCAGCALEYAIVFAYAAIALAGFGRGAIPEARRALLLAGGTTAVAYLLVLYPGLKTPRGVTRLGRESVAQAAQQSESASGPVRSGDADRDDKLQRLVSNLSPEMQQTLSDSLFIYRASPSASFPPRSLLGPADAPVRITVFTDVLCDHCAELEETLTLLSKNLPAEGFSIEPRHFPLDRACNPLIRSTRDPGSVRCLGARAQICLEGRSRAMDFSAALFANQRNLTSEKVFQLATPFIAREALESCISDASTDAKLKSDVETAGRFDPDGTPLVLVNGRRGTSFGPFLYAMVLTRGSASHPAFESLPEPNPRAHLH